jgi:uridine phosphorylase
MNQHFKPLHLSANADDLAGNNGIGRYILLPGSDGRAEQISKAFDNRIVKTHSRGHHLYLGTISAAGKKIDVASIASGMGCPSLEIILHELYHLGAKRFLRVGTAGSLQPGMVQIGDIVNAYASVRDEKTTSDYAPIEVPAVSSFEFVQAISQAAQFLKIEDKVHCGTVHCKSSFYAREFGAGPLNHVNQSYLNLLKQCGVLATEMETAALFMQSQLYHYELMKKGHGPQYQVFCGAILGILSVVDGTAFVEEFASHAVEKTLTQDLIKLALESIKIMAITDENSFNK